MWNSNNGKKGKQGAFKVINSLTKESQNPPSTERSQKDPFKGPKSSLRNLPSPLPNDNNNLPPRSRTEDPTNRLVTMCRVTGPEEAEKTLKEQKILPSKKGAEKSKYFTTSPEEHSFNYKNRQRSSNQDRLNAAKEEILEIIADGRKMNYFASNLVHQREQKNNPEASQYNTERMRLSSLTHKGQSINIGVNPQHLKEVNDAVIYIEKLRPRTVPQNISRVTRPKPKGQAYLPTKFP